MLEKPDWLNFSGSSRTFSGMPDSLKDAKIRIKAVDNKGKFVEDEFII